MARLNIADSDLHTAKTQLTTVRVNTGALSICHDPVAAFGSAAVGDAVTRAQHIVTASASALAEVTASQARALDSISHSFNETDQHLARDAS